MFSLLFWLVGQGSVFSMMTTSDLIGIEPQLLQSSRGFVQSGFFLDLVDEVRKPDLALEKRDILERVLQEALKNVSYTADTSILRFYGDQYQAIQNYEAVIEAALQSHSCHILFFGLRLAQYRGILTVEHLQRAKLQVERGMRGNLSAQIYYRFAQSPFRHIDGLLKTWRTYGHIRDGYSRPNAYDFIYEFASQIPGGDKFIIDSASSWNSDQARDAVLAFALLGEEGQKQAHYFSRLSLRANLREAAKSVLEKSRNLYLTKG